jgi:uncharacterized membrane protein YeaQ/YmgE (transglycosylase-associated protein family)
MPYRSTPQDKRTARRIGVIYLFLAFLLGLMLIKIWPPMPWPAAKNPEDSPRVDAIIAAAQAGCSESQTQSNNNQAATATQTPAAAAGVNNSQTPTPTPTATATPTPSPAGAQRPAPANNAGGPQKFGPAAGGTTPPTENTPPKSDGGSENKPNPPAAVVDRTGQIISLPIQLYPGRCVQTTFDERLILLVIVAGILGAFVHGATSLADFLGNNNFNSSWSWFYFLRPAIGMSLALVFYFVIRGGFLSTTGGASDINPYGIAALAGLVGMFSKQATDKLSEVFGTLFRAAPGQGDAKRQDPLKPPPVPIKLDPSIVVAGGEAFKLTVSGTGFVQGDTIKVNETTPPTTVESATTLSAQIPKETIATPATLKVTVVNPDQTAIGSADLVVSAPAAPGAPGAPGASTPADGAPPAPPAPPLGETPAEETPVSGEETGDNELIDGCDVDMEADTPDEDLPITKGGVN